MAPTLIGPTHLATCPACQFEFPIAVETFRSTLPTRCGRCGGLCEIATEIRPGQTVTLEPLSNPQRVKRWDVIAFMEPGSGIPQVKRVWGLPGEAIELRNGEAWVDGELLRKSLAELQNLAVPVYDLRTGGSAQWLSSTDPGRSSPGHSHSQIESEIYRGVPKAPSPSLSVLPGKPLRLQYRRPAPVHPTDVPTHQWLQPSLVVDDYSINQGLSTALHPVHDSLLSLSLRSPLTSPLQLKFRVHERIACIVLEPAVGLHKQASQTTDDSPSNRAQTNDHRAAHAQATWSIVGQQQLHVGWCDGRLLLKTDVQSRVIGENELQAALSAEGVLPAEGANSEGAPLPEQPAWDPYAICQVEATSPIDITQFQMARDLYLIPPRESASVLSTSATSGSLEQDSAARTPQRLAGYYVLGDNLPISLDSRGPLGRVAPAQVLGRISSTTAQASAGLSQAGDWDE